MKGKDSGLAHGTLGSPQTNFEQDEYANKVASNEAQLKAKLAEPMIDEALVAEFEQNNVKFSRDEMIFITRDRTGQIIWLEQGNSLAGFEHIIKRGHDKDLAKAFDSNIDDVARLLRDVVKYGDVISCTLKTVNGKEGYEKKYDYGGRHIVLAAIGMNGFLVSAYPE